MPILVDTSVVICALRPARKGDSNDVRVLCLSAKRLLAEKDFCLSSISLLEVLRGLKENEMPAFQQFAVRGDVRPVTAAVAERAWELLKDRGINQKVCRRCLGARDTSPCAECGANVSRQQRLNDALIVATA